MTEFLEINILKACVTQGEIKNNEWNFHNRLIKGMDTMVVIIEETKAFFVFVSFFLKISHKINAQLRIMVIS